VGGVERCRDLTIAGATRVSDTDADAVTDMLGERYLTDFEGEGEGGAGECGPAMHAVGLSELVRANEMCPAGVGACIVCGYQ
jgi:hypothetical protein